MALALFISIMEPTISTAQSINEKVFRLHILANSNSSLDQTIKLKVRDFVLIEMADMFKGNSLDENIKIANDNIDNITNSINNYLLENNFNYKASVSVCREYFKTRVYDDYTLPAGVYNSLKIELGKGEGHNWWCIIFPTVCLPACSQSIDEYLTEDEKELINSGYTPRFKIIEIYNRIINNDKNKSTYN